MENVTGRGTVVAIVGDATEDALEALGGLRGVDVLPLRGSEPGLATRRIGAAQRPWIVHDADPLEHVAAAWVELFEERSTLGVLEREVQAALEQFEMDEAVMPDYYIVLDPEGAEATWRHWWCGALGHHAPKRVLPAHRPVSSRDDALARVLNALPTSPPWPEPSSWLPRIPFEIPDRVGLRDRRETAA
ncbi:hypothetical protein [Microbacterium xanthum]|uniref:hypothetical protein n=1 Tax=Microbacterium xanthum TaxID=3079794 RepID=UPI002AD4B02D|nr:hypothetical protein [Microbacterium sp. KSW-48]MDZ8171714.1 hypothetical protein [Microbacterium sp. KSW-48]